MLRKSIKSIISPYNKLCYAKFCSHKVENYKTTVDAEQVKVLEKYRDFWWNENGPIKALHVFNKLRVPFIIQGLMKMIPEQNKYKDTSMPLRNLKILDIGCGGGILAESIAKHGAVVTGVDASADLIFVAKSHANLNPDLKNNLHFIHSTIEKHSLDTINYYDAVIASEVIEHIVEKNLFVENCAKLVKSGGSLFFTTFNKTILSKFFSITLLENVFKCIPKGTHDYKLYISPEDLIQILQKNNCESILTKGINYNPFKNEWIYMNTLQFSYILQAVKF